MLQFNTYHSVYSNKKLVQHRWADWSHISKQEDLKSVIPLFESCKLTQFYGFQQRYDENIIREFYATLYIPEDKMKLFWMFRGGKFSCNAREFASVFNLPSGDALPQLHLFDQMTDKDKRKFYTRGAKKIGLAAELLPVPKTANQIARTTFHPKAGNPDQSSKFGWHVMDFIMKGQEFDVVNFIFREMDDCKRDIVKNLYFAPYLMKFILDKAQMSTDDLKLVAHPSYQPRGDKQTSTHSSPLRKRKTTSTVSPQEPAEASVPA